MPKNGSTGLLGGQNGDVLESDLVKQVLKSELLKQILYVLKTHFDLKCSTATAVKYCRCDDQGNYAILPDVLPR